MPATTAIDHVLSPGEAIWLDGTIFNGDTAELTTAGRALIKHLAASLGGAKAITIEGHADYADRASRTRRLSLDRAEAVLAELTKLGITATPITAGQGATQPAVIGGTPTQRNENRRVVITVIR